MTHGPATGWIACLLVPHFAAESARRALGVPRSRPLVVAGPKHVTGTCAVAARRGVRIGMTPRQAAYLCPEADIIPDDEEARHAAADRIRRRLAAFTDYVEVEGIYAPPRDRRRHPQTVDARQSAMFYTDLGQLTPVDALRQVREMATVLMREADYAAAAGLARNKFAAYAAAASAEIGCVEAVSPGAEAAFLAPLPVTLLPLAPDMARKLAALGLVTLGALAALPPGAALAQFGKGGLAAYQMARGYDPRRVGYFSRVKPLRLTCQFEGAVEARDMLESALRGAANRLAAHLRAEGYMARSLGLTLHLESGEICARRTTLREAASGAPRLAEAVLRLFGQVRISTSITGFELRLEDLLPLAARQLPLFPDEDTSRQALQEALATLAARPDAPRCFRIITLRPTARRIERRYGLEVA